MTNLIDNPLIQNYKTPPWRPKRVIIIGNGAINNGNTPLQQALYSLTRKNPSPIDFVRQKNPDPATYLAAYSHEYRVQRNTLLKNIRNEKALKEFENCHQGEFIEKLYDFRIRLATEFAQSAELNLHSQDWITEQFLSPEVAIVTINWDKVLWETPKNCPMIQLHGLCDHPESLILPSELSHDEVGFEIFSSLPGVEAVAHRLNRYFRGPFRDHLSNAHSITEQWIRQADELIVWGVALNAYDAELLSVIRAWNLDTPKQSIGAVKIVNPNKKHRDVTASMLGLVDSMRVDYDPLRNEISTVEQYGSWTPPAW